MSVEVCCKKAGKIMHFILCNCNLFADALVLLTGSEEKLQMMILEFYLLC